jgi:hypothetical protein
VRVVLHRSERSGRLGNIGVILDAEGLIASVVDGFLWPALIGV